MEWTIESAMPGMAWPAVPASAAAAVLALLQQLEHTQWLSPERLRENQARQLGVLLEHAYASVPYYRKRWRGVPRALEDIALLTRRELQENYAALKSERIPPEHGASGEVRTSGSTGAPVRVLKTQLCQLLWNAITLRDHLWHRRELRGKLAVIRHAVNAHESPTWGIATAGVVKTGPAVALAPTLDAASQLDWLERERPAYLLTYPSLAETLARLSLARGARLEGLREVRTFGEMLPASLRELCRAAWGAPLVDMYSANETGYIALQCPEREAYHAQSEAVMVEVLDEQGRPCAIGETGRVVVTDLVNFAMPLVRYDIGDYAEVGAPCSCARGLPVLARVAGRVRNMLVTAQGKRYWPLLGSRKFIETAPVLQHQVAQKEFDLVELRLVTARPLERAEEERLRALVLAGMPPGMRIAVRYMSSIPRGEGGKFEDFVCELR